MSKKTPDTAGLDAARRFAGWHIGDQSWADSIIAAYLDPDKANADMDAEDVPVQTGIRRRYY